MKFVKYAGIGLAGLLVLVILVAGIARIVIDGPIGPLAGGRLDGIERSVPEDWGFTDAHFTIAVEVQPTDPHSVTVVCFVSDGELYIPARNAAEKEWPQMALADGRARIGVGDDLYRVQLVKVEDQSERERGLRAAGEKYPQLAEQSDGTIPEGVWLFRAERRL